MIQLSDAITLNELLDKYPQDGNLFDKLIEFSAFASLAKGIKERGCRCGRYQEIQQAQILFNQIAKNLSDESVARIKSIFEKDQLCFGIQTIDNFDLKCY